MARDFKIQEAKEVVDEHKYLLQQLSEAFSISDSIINSVMTASKSMVMEKTVDLMRSVSIDEITKGKGIRVKALHEYGYDTVADILAASRYQLAAVRGISDNTAYEIKKLVDEYYTTSTVGQKIKLSVDDKTKYSSELVHALSLYRHCNDICNECIAMVNNNQGNIQYAIDNLAPVLGTLKWTFASYTKKSTATAAYNYLGSLLFGDYGAQAQACIDELQAARKVSQQQAWYEFERDPISFINVLEKIEPELLGSDDENYGLPEDLAREIQDECFFPDGLLCTLRKYQEWGVKYILHQERVLLGDEMGLGKTVQAIASMVSLRNTGATHFLVVCPASVLENWIREIRKHSKLRAVKVHGAGAKNAISGWIKSGGVAVTTYETTRNFEVDENYKFSMIVVDEAHYIKNPAANRTENVKKIAAHAERMLFLTGTPIENKVDEMVKLIGILQPAVARKVENMTHLSAAPIFRKTIAPVYYRRKREDVLTELPELIESREWCEMGAIEENIYETQLKGSNSYMAARRLSWNVDNLKQSSKAKRLLELIDEAREDNRKILVFSYFRDTLFKIGTLLGDRCMGPINGSVNVNKRQEIIDNFEEADAGTVLLAQIQAGGTGLNIQAASVVIICEPQLKPSIENQAISRAYRMGQSRNVLVHRLLCQGTIDERVTNMLDEKQKIFDAFADKSVAADSIVEVDDKSFGELIKEEIERINKKNGVQSDSSEAPDSGSTDDNPTDGNDKTQEEYVDKSTWGSVTHRVRNVPQPYGGYLNPKSFDTFSVSNENTKELNPTENIDAGFVGLAVDYLARFMSTNDAEKAFEISLLGAEIARELPKAQALLNSVKGLDDASIINAAKLVGYDGVYRAGCAANVDAINPDAATIENIRMMVERVCQIIECLDDVIFGFDLKGGYTDWVSSGDGDFMNPQSVWDIKVSKKGLTKEQTLQLLMYWRMGLRSEYPEFKTVEYLAIFNPRLNMLYRIPVDRIPQNVIDDVDKKVIGYK